MLKIPQIHAIFFKFAEFGKVRNSLERLPVFQLMQNVEKGTIGIIHKTKSCKLRYLGIHHEYHWIARQHVVASEV